MYHVENLRVVTDVLQALDWHMAFSICLSCERMLRQRRPGIGCLLLDSRELTRPREGEIIALCCFVLGSEAVNSQPPHVGARLAEEHTVTLTRA